MTKDFLFEIGVEEMPAHVVSKSVKQLADRTGKFLKENGLGFKEIKTYSTPRRLTVLVKELDEKQADVDEVKKGPAKKIAQDADGNWTKAAVGFARGQGMSADQTGRRHDLGPVVGLLAEIGAGRAEPGRILEELGELEGESALQERAVARRVETERARRLLGRCRTGVAQAKPETEDMTEDMTDTEAQKRPRGA